MGWADKERGASWGKKGGVKCKTGKKAGEKACVLQDYWMLSREKTGMLKESTT